jgi:hypothetical protein
MSRTDKLVSKFLRELSTSNVQETFRSLEALLDHLETKHDPEPGDMQIVDNAYQLLEQLKFLEGTLKRYVGDSDSILKGNKLQRLYAKAPKNTGSQVMFD